MRKRRIMVIAFFVMLFAVSCLIAVARYGYFQIEENKRSQEANIIVDESQRASDKRVYNETIKEIVSKNNIVRSANYT